MQKAACEFHIGKIECSLWANRDATGGTWYSTAFHRVYYEGDTPRTASSFGRDDLLVVAELARQAFLWIAEQQGVVKRDNT